MMKQRAILLIPKLSNFVTVEQIRKEYDPLYQKVPPHITLVFPFKSSIETSQLINHIQNQLKKNKKFQINLKEISFRNDGYIFWHVAEGQKEIISLHDDLYSGELSGLLNQEISYIPHITLGSRCTLEEIKIAQEKLKEINLLENCEDYQIILEEIQGNGQSIVLESFDVIEKG